MFKIAICAGHGYNTGGKRTPDGEREWSFNDKIVKAFINTMNQYEGVTIKRFDDPTGKTDVSLINRTNGANAWGASIYISIHHNANTGRWGNWGGVETFVYTGNKNKQSGQLAKLVHPALVKAYGLRDRGIKEGNLHIVRETKMPAILIEGGFMDSTTDIKKLRDDKVLSNVGVAIAHATATYAKLKKKSGSSKTTQQVVQKTTNSASTSVNTANTTTYKVVKGDTLYGISKKFNISVDTIKSLNNLTSNIIKIGQVLKVKK